MLIKNNAIKQVPLDRHFFFEQLYNDNRGGMFKQELTGLLHYAFENKLITIEKYVLTTNIIENSHKLSKYEKLLFHRLQDYHNERDEHATALLYFLNLIDPSNTITTKDKQIEIISSLYDISIRPRIDDKNAEPKLYFNNEQTAIISTNENVTNLFDILVIQNVTVYIIEHDYFSGNLYSYKLIRDDAFFDLAAKYSKDLKVKLKETYDKFR